MKLLIGADLVPTPSNWDKFITGDIQGLLGDGLLHVLETADYRIFNLEIPLTDRNEPIKKCGPNFSAPVAIAAGLRAMGVDLVTLANNHIMDQGHQGLMSTLDALNTNGISWLGVGNTREEAEKPLLLEFDGVRLGIYACAENEFSIASDTMSGANPFDPLWSLDHIRQLKDQCDYVIVLYHGGKEEYRYPSPELSRICRRIADKGADLIICQHSHCIGCREEWNGSTIIYGQGNFLFDRKNKETYQTGLLVELEIGEGEKSISYIPIVRRDETVRLAEGEKVSEILDAFSQRSEEIQKPGFVKEKYSQFATDNVMEYYGRSLGRMRYIIFRLLNLLCFGKLTKKCYSIQDALTLINTLECEPHRELYIAALKAKVYKDAEE